jgi:hypothetical protein
MQGLNSQGGQSTRRCGTSDQAAGEQDALKYVSRRHLVDLGREDSMRHRDANSLLYHLSSQCLACRHSTTDMSQLQTACNRRGGYVWQWLN